MFTGIIEGLGTVRSVSPGAGGGVRLQIQHPFDAATLAIGDSVAHNGVCLTLVSQQGDTYVVDVGPQTLDRTTVGAFKTGERINLERALCLGDRLGGHLVQGHVDGVARVISRDRRDNATDFGIEAPRELMPFIAAQGSVAVDGISLTVTDVQEAHFWVSIIPHTLAVTALDSRAVGEAVNVEVDLMARYVVRALSAQGGTSGLTEARLRELGY